MMAEWIRNRPPRPDPKGQAAAERVQDDLIQEVAAHAERIVQSVAEQDPQLAARIEAAARQRKLELERDLILRRSSEPS